MSVIYPLIIFIISCYGLGRLFSPTKLRFAESTALGLAAIPVLGVILNLLRVPLDWRVYFGLALLYPFSRIRAWLKKGGTIPKIKPCRPSWQAAVILVVFLFALVIYCGGPFQYPWLENDDSWSHAASAKYVAVEKNLNAPHGVFQYLNPYPPGYSIIMGLMHQIHPSLYWTLKFFNGLIISLGFLFFYRFTEELTRNKGKAALATAFLALIPCYLTHFIWSHSLVITLFFPAFYFLLKSFKDKSFMIPAAVSCAAITLTQPTQAIKFAVMAGLLVLAHIPVKIRWKNIAGIFFLSAVLSLLWWGPVMIQTIQGRSHIAVRDDIKISGLTANTHEVLPGLFHPAGGTATEAYSWKHYLFIERPALITNPTGLGPMIFFLALAGLFFLCVHLVRKPDTTRPKPYYITVLCWLIFTFLGMNSMTFNLPIGLFAFRFWMLFAVPVALLCAEALYSISDLLSLKHNKILVICVFFIGTLRSNLPFKWEHNTSEWHYGIHWMSDEDIDGYVWLRRHIPAGTRVFTFTDNILVLGHDMRADFWQTEYQQRFNGAFHHEMDLLFQNLSDNNFELLVISPRDIRRFGREEVNTKMKALVTDPRFSLIFHNHAVKIFHIHSNDQET